MRILPRALVLLLAACGAEPPAPLPPQISPAAPAPFPAPPAPATASAPMIPSAAPEIDERPVAPRPRLDEKTLLLESVHVYGERVVFPDEAAPLADALAVALANPKHGGYKVVPLDELRKSWAEAREGKLPDVGFVCESAPPPFELSKALHPGASTASATIRCPAKKKGPCVLEVVVRAPAGPGQADEPERARLTMDLPRASSSSDWASRIRKGKLVAPKPAKLPETADMLGILSGGMKPGIYVTLHERVLEGPWEGAFTDKDIDPIRADLAACKKSVTKRWRDFYAATHLIEVALDGKITRCESNLPERSPPPELDCQCAALRKLSFGTAKGVRRAALDIFTTTVGPPRKMKLLAMAFLGKERADDPTAIAGSEPVLRSDLEDCLGAIESPFGELSVPVRFVVGPDGRVKKHKAEWPSNIPKSAAVCMDSALAKAWFNCPIAGRATIDATLDLTLKRY